MVGGAVRACSRTLYAAADEAAEEAAAGWAAEVPVFPLVDRGGGSGGVARLWA